MVPGGDTVTSSSGEVYVLLMPWKPQKFQRFSRLAPTPVSSCLKVQGSRERRASTSVGLICRHRWRGERKPFIWGLIWLMINVTQWKPLGHTLHVRFIPDNQLFALAPLQLLRFCQISGLASRACIFYFLFFFFLLSCQRSEGQWCCWSALEHRKNKTEEANWFCLLCAAAPDNQVSE